MSDLHLECERDQGAAFIASLYHLEPADVAVVAGDAATGRFPDQLRELALALLANHRDVILIPGNHEYYRTSPAQVERSLELAAAVDPGRVHAFPAPRLQVIQGAPFYCGTMWFPERPGDWLYEGYINDFNMIQDFKPWVYEQHQAFRVGFGLAPKSCVVVSHHLPSLRSTPARFKGSPINRFFSADVEDLVEFTQPRLWLHGHTHDPCDYQLGKTRVVCHPRGYPRERPDGRDYQPLLLEV